MEIEGIERGFKAIQNEICGFLVERDGTIWREDLWDYTSGSGGGISRIWEGAPLLEKAGVNFSSIRGASLPVAATERFNLQAGTPFAATGVSLVIHPWSPFIPTIHMNIRYFEAGDKWWFGGGIDCTPYYPVREQVIGFHKALKILCENHGRDFAADKQACDQYFHLRHRNEARGIGGIFFDHVQGDKAANLKFVTALGMAFPDLYRPFVEENVDKPFSQKEKQFQLYRRSRYVEFNLVYDRGTLFGLQSGGRTESILMSMPPLAAWKYDWHAPEGSEEALLTDDFLKPRDWASL